jgi:hypothetical protein
VSPGPDSKLQLIDRFAVPGPLPDSELLAVGRVPGSAESSPHCEFLLQIQLPLHCEFLVQLQFQLLHLSQCLVKLILVQLVVPALGSRLSGDRGIPW